MLHLPLLNNLQLDLNRFEEKKIKPKPVRWSKKRISGKRRSLINAKYWHLWNILAFSFEYEFSIILPPLAILPARESCNVNYSSIQSHYDRTAKNSQNSGIRRAQNEQTSKARKKIWNSEIFLIAKVDSLNAIFHLWDGYLCIAYLIWNKRKKNKALIGSILYEGLPTHSHSSMDSILFIMVAIFFAAASLHRNGMQRKNVDISQNRSEFPWLAECWCVLSVPHLYAHEQCAGANFEIIHIRISAIFVKVLIWYFFNGFFWTVLRAVSKFSRYS